MTWQKKSLWTIKRKVSRFPLPSSHSVSSIRADIYQSWDEWFHTIQPVLVARSSSGCRTAMYSECFRSSPGLLIFRSTSTIFRKLSEVWVTPKLTAVRLVVLPQQPRYKAVWNLLFRVPTTSFQLFWPFCSVLCMLHFFGAESGNGNGHCSALALYWPLVISSVNAVLSAILLLCESNIVVLNYFINFYTFYMFIFICYLFSFDIHTFSCKLGIF